jgi:phosphoribosylaminoimidazolecarboxamide formyltransferase/IMP cyclohydrolase
VRGVFCFKQIKKDKSKEKKEVVMKQKFALLSVFHKEGIVEFAQALLAMEWNILASGGTARHLAAAGIDVSDVAELVGGGPILGHRVVTLSREVHAGLLATYSPEDIAEMNGLEIPFIDLVCVDLYPLVEEINKEDSTPHSVIEKTDIGGPTMLRSAAKGQRIVICDPADRMRTIEWMNSGRPNEYIFKKALAAKAEFIISNYCLASASYHSNGKYQGLSGELIQQCKYGENAYQTPAGLYSTGADDSLALTKFLLVAGDAPSYNNWVDIDRLLQTITRVAAIFDINHHDCFDKDGPSIALGVKHGNVCGAGIGFDGQTILDKEILALQGMISGDPLALFGGLVMVNFPIGIEEAKALLHYEMEEGEDKKKKRRLLDGIIAPSFTVEAIELLQRKNGKCRLLANEALLALDRNSLDKAQRFRYVRGGFLSQPNYTFCLDTDTLKWMTNTYPKPAANDKWSDLYLAVAICQTSNSNTITLVNDGMLIGNGVGQQSRVGGAKVALLRAKDAGHDTQGATAASDSFFPFPDGVEVLVDAGIDTIFATSGSVNDQQVIDLCNEKKVSLLMGPDFICRGFFGH